MSKSFAKDKGARGERQIIQLLQPVVDACYARRALKPPTMARNSMQSRFGGFDICGLLWAAIEVKHQETLNLKAWWDQCVRQTIDHQESIGKTYGRPVEAILLYKANNIRWRARIYGYLPAGPKRIRTPVDIDIEAFLLWFEHRLTSELIETGQGY